MTNKNLPEGYEDDLTKLLKPKEQRQTSRVGEHVLTITDISVRLEIVKLIKSGVTPTAVTFFIKFLNENVSREEFVYYIYSLPLVQTKIFKEELEKYFNLGNEEHYHIMFWDTYKEA